MITISCFEYLQYTIMTVYFRHNEVITYFITRSMVLGSYKVLLCRYKILRNNHILARVRKCAIIQDQVAKRVTRNQTIHENRQHNHALLSITKLRSSCAIIFCICNVNSHHHRLLIKICTIFSLFYKTSSYKLVNNVHM